MSDTVTVTLSGPITHDKTTISELTFREATVGDLMIGAAFKDEMVQTMAVLAAISDTPLPLFRKVKARDLKKIMLATVELMGNEDSDTTGE